MNNIIFHYAQHCKTHVRNIQPVKDIVNDGAFTKLIGFAGELLYARKNPVSIKELQSKLVVKI